MFNDKCVDTDGCEGPMSEEVEVMSAEDIPRSTPTKVGARPFNSTAIRVHWNPVPNVRDKVRFGLYFGSVMNSFSFVLLTKYLLILFFILARSAES